MAASEASGLVWSWVIETLASSREVDVGILYDLISGTPKLSDILGKEAREMVALRCLEGLFDSVKGFKGSVTLSSHQSRFDSSECSENVLHRVLQEFSLPNLRGVQHEVAGDVHLFIDQRKAYLPKCALEQLKDRILEGQDPLFESLKKSSGLAFQSQRKQTIHVHGNDSGIPVLRSENSRLIEQSAEIREDKDSPHPEKGNDQLEGASLSRISICSKRNKTCSETEMHSLGSLINRESAGPPKNKKLKHDLGDVTATAEQSVNHQASVPASDEKIQADEHRDETARVSDHKTNNGEDGNSEARLPVAAFVEGSHSKVFGEENQENNDIHFQLTQEDERSCGEEDIDDVAEKGQDDSEKHIEPDMTLDHNKREEEEATFGLKMTNFMNSQLTVSEDSLIAAERTERNICMKCNKGGNVLTCSASGCPIVVHESCLGFSASFDERGKFCCPFCAYSRAVAECAKAKNKASLARQELSMFISGKPSFQPQDQSKILEENLPQSPQHGDKDKSNDRNYGDKTSKNKQQEGPSGPCIVNVIPSKAKNSNLKKSSRNMHLKEREKKMMVEEHRTVERSNRKQKEKQVEQQCDEGFHEDENIAIGGQKRAEGKFTQETQGHQLPDPSKNSFAASMSDIEEASEEENKNPTYSKYSLRCLKKETGYVYPATPQGRRIRIAWTTEEEEMLKEGMKRFASGNDHNIPWKSILEFGCTVFSNTRSTVDLKDKWRNMIKADPDLKNLLAN